VTKMSDEKPTRVRWRMTLDELSAASRSKPSDLDRWRAMGVFGDRWKEPRDRGAWRHITKEVAHRAIIMRTLLDLGLTETAATQIARQHEIKQKDDPLVVVGKNGTVTVWRSNLKLP
jgi:myo-inositol catabolism protein IolC